MKQRKVSLELIEWNSASDHASDKEDVPENIPPCNHDDSDLDYPAPLFRAVDIKISPSVIIQLKYDSTVAQYNNWLADLKTAFDEDPAKFFTSHQKIILASIILNKQLKIVYNSAITTTFILS